MNGFRQFKQMFLTQLRMTYREKQAWFWGIFFPVILMVIFMSIFSDNSDNDFNVNVALVNEHPNETSEMLYQQISHIPVMEIQTGEPVTREEAEEMVADQEVNAAIVLPESDDDTSLLLIVNKEDEQGIVTQALTGMLNEFVHQANLFAAGAEPIYEIEYEAITSGDTEFSYTDFLLTGMIALSIAQGGIFGMVDLVDMRRKGLIKRLRMTPADMNLFGFSDMVMRLIFSVVQIILLSLIGVFIFGANLFINFAGLIVVFLLGAISFNAIGYFFSSFSKTTEAFMGIANIVNFLMMFLSGVFFPVETMPDWLHPVSNVLPLTYFVDGLRETMIYETSIFNAELWTGIGIMVLWGAVTFMLGSWLYKRQSIVATR